MHTRSKSYPNNSNATIPRRSNRRRVPNIVEPEIRTIEEVVPMVDRTMEGLLQAPTKGTIMSLTYAPEKEGITAFRFDLAWKRGKWKYLSVSQDLCDYCDFNFTEDNMNSLENASSSPGNELMFCCQRMCRRKLLFQPECIAYLFNINCLEVLVSNQQSGNPTFSLHQKITSSKVTHEIHDSEGCNFLSEELPDIDSFNNIHPHFDDNPLSGSTTYSSNSLLEEFTFNNLDDNDVVRVCLLLALYYVFMGQEIKHVLLKAIVNLVDNLSKWDKFPWGEYMWREFHKRVYNVVTKHREYHLKMLGNNPRYVANYAFLEFFTMVTTPSPATRGGSSSRNVHTCVLKEIRREVHVRTEVHSFFEEEVCTQSVDKDDVDKDDVPEIVVLEKNVKEQQMQIADMQRRLLSLEDIIKRLNNEPYKVDHNVDNNVDHIVGDRVVLDRIFKEQ
nr:phospholipase-like protein [Tanacetum cinerariifolium]